MDNSQVTNKLCYLLLTNTIVCRLPSEMIYMKYKYLLKVVMPQIATFDPSNHEGQRHKIEACTYVRCFPTFWLFIFSLNSIRLEIEDTEYL